MNLIHHFPTMGRPIELQKPPCTSCDGWPVRDSSSCDSIEQLNESTIVFQSTRLYHNFGRQCLYRAGDCTSQCCPHRKIDGACRTHHKLAAASRLVGQGELQASRLDLWPFLEG